MGQPPDAPLEEQTESLVAPFLAPFEVAILLGRKGRYSWALCVDADVKRGMMSLIKRQLQFVTVLSLATMISIACGDGEESSGDGDGDGDAGGDGDSTGDGDVGGDGDGDTAGDGDVGGDGDTVGDGDTSGDGDGDGDSAGDGDGDGDNLGGSSGDGDGDALGGSSGDGDGDGSTPNFDLVGSCTTAGSTCVGYYGSFWTTQAIEGGCVGGTPSASACSLEGAVGYCVSALSDAVEAQTQGVYYTNPGGSGVYQSICEQSGGSWTSLL